MLSYTGGHNTNTSGINYINENRNITITASHTGIIVRNAIGKDVNVFALDGVQIVQHEVRSNNEIIALVNGVYLVEIENIVVKVIVK